MDRFRSETTGLTLIGSETSSCLLVRGLHRKGAVLKRPNVWPVAVRALCRRFFVNNHRFAFGENRLLVTLVTSHIGVATLQGKMRLGVVIERRGHPAL